MLEVQNLCRNFRGIPAIESVSFKVAHGAGKSTTVKIITGMLRANEGRVLFEGQDVRKDMVAFRSAFGYVPEEAHLYNYLSGLEYLQLVGRLRGLGEQLIEAKATRLLKLLRLESWQYSPISSYSKGMRQRVLIAAVLYISHVLEVVEQVCNRVIVIAEGKLLADAPPAELTTLMRLPTLESVFAQLVLQQDMRSIAQEVVAVMQLDHA
jgi:ABC-2 type transport system ATP-binding protein